MGGSSGKEVCRAKYEAASDAEMLYTVLLVHLYLTMEPRIIC